MDPFGSSRRISPSRPHRSAHSATVPCSSTPLRPDTPVNPSIVVARRRVLQRRGLSPESLCRYPVQRSLDVKWRQGSVMTMKLTASLKEYVKATLRSSRNYLAQTRRVRPSRRQIQSSGSGGIGSRSESNTRRSEPSMVGPLFVSRS